MNEHMMQKRWTRATQMIFMAAMLSSSAACNTISGADSIKFVEPDEHGTSAGTTGGSGTDAVPPMGEVKQIHCGVKEVMVGVEGSYSSWIDSVEAMCAELKGDGTLGTSHPSMEFGGTKAENQNPYDAVCESGQVVGEFGYNNDKQNPTHISQVRIGCATVSGWKNSGMVSYSEYKGIDIPDMADEMPVSLTCKPGEIADGVDVLVGEDGMKIHVKSFDSLHCIKAPGP